MVRDDPIAVAGAGLAAAITLARAGRAVTVHEAQAGVGHRFGRDLQGLESWSTREDALAVLLVMGGSGTVKTCMFSGFKREALYVERTVAAFQRLVGLDMIAPCAHGGVGNLRLAVSARSGTHPVAGGQAGFQDTSWGFGMRAAIRSGVLAARSLLDGGDYEARWRRELGGLITTSLLNRAAYSLLGNRGYRRLLRRRAAHADARKLLHRYYGPSAVKRLLAPLVPLARWRYGSRRADETCNHVDCTCVWCRHGRELHA